MVWSPNDGDNQSPWGSGSGGNNKKGSSKGNGSFDPGDYDDILKNIQYLRTNLHRMEQYEITSWAKIINLGLKQINYHNLLEIHHFILNQYYFQALGQGAFQ